MFRNIVLRRTFGAALLASSLRYQSPSTLIVTSAKYALTTSIRYNSTKDLNDFEFDPLASVKHDAAVETAKQSKESIVNSFLPEGTLPSAFTKVDQYLEKYPVDSLIVMQQVKITHVQNPETGAEERMGNLSPCTLEEALEQARERGMNLVQMGSSDGVAFCRIRDEKPWIMNLIKEDMQTPGDSSVPQEKGKEMKLKDIVDHQFRDVVDAHFIGWKSKKIAEDIKKKHPVRLSIKEFQNAESAVYKLKEMVSAIDSFCESKKILYYFNNIATNDREVSIILTPAGDNQNNLKHPTEKDWAGAVKRMAEACKKSGRIGTYVKSNTLKQRNVGATFYRVDKYGRRIE